MVEQQVKKQFSPRRINRQNSNQQRQTTNQQRQIANQQVNPARRRKLVEIMCKISEITYTTVILNYSGQYIRLLTIVCCRWGRTQQNISSNPILQVSVPNKPTKSVSIQLSPNRQQNPQQRRLSNKVFQVSRTCYPLDSVLKTC